MNFEPLTEDTFGAFFGGHSYPFRSQFDAAGVKGGVFNNADGEKGEYVRVIPSMHVDQKQEF